VLGRAFAVTHNCSFAVQLSVEAATCTGCMRENIEHQAPGNAAAAPISIANNKWSLSRDDTQTKVVGILGDHF